MNRTLAWLALALACYAASGLRLVGPDEVAVVRRLGAVLPQPEGPGLHWGLPWGVEQADRVKLGRTLTLKVGAPGPGDSPAASAFDPSMDEFLTGDLNLIAAEVLVQYRVREPALYLFQARELEALVAEQARWAAADEFAHSGIDALLTTGRAEVALRLGRRMQALADDHQLGIAITAVRLGRVAPPSEVAPAFADAARARSDKRRAVTRALEYRDRAQSDARGRAQAIADRAAGRVSRLVEPARGEADRFARVLAEKQRNPAAIQTRLLLEALAELLPRLRKTVVVDSDQSLDMSVIEPEPPRNALRASPIDAKSPGAEP